MRIRDAIWLDVEFTPKEEAILRTPTFQRLQRIKQLGNAYHVYPCATHTRFSHSLGVCHVAKLLCEKAGTPQKDREQIALAALLHDITHTPFAHTLSGELGLFTKWEARNLYERRFDDISNELGHMTVETLDPADKGQLHELLHSSDFISMASGHASKLQEPHTAELIADSFCADLLDYVARDALFCGLTRRWDPRIVDHAALLIQKDKRHFGLDITAPSLLNGRMRSTSVVEEYVHLLDIRYTLSARIYYYDAKLEADALLGKAFRIMLAESEKIGGKSVDDFLYDASDELLVEGLCNHANPEVSYLGKRLRNRYLPYQVHEIRRGEVTESERACFLMTFRGRKNLSKWLGAEADIAKGAGVRPADIMVQCHKPEMSLKGANVLIRDEAGEVRVLNKYEEIPQAGRLAQAHQELWRLHVFSGDRDVPTCNKVRAAAKEVLSELLAEEK